MVQVLAATEMLESAASSPRQSLRGLVEKARSETFFDHHITKTPLVIRFVPIEREELATIQKKHGLVDTDDPFSEKNYISYCDIIIACCEGIYIKQDGDLIPALGLDPAPTFESDELHEDLDVDIVLGESPVDAVKALFPFDLIVLRLGNEILQFSMGVESDVQDNIRGNS